MPTGEETLRGSDEETIAQTVQNGNVHDSELMDKWNEAQKREDFIDENQEFVNEKNAVKNWESAQAPLFGRLSPIVKEKIYRAYHKGATIKDLSLKYGVMPQRVKAIIY